MSTVVNPLDGSQFPSVTAPGGATTRALVGCSALARTSGGPVTIQRPSPRVQGSIFGVCDADGLASSLIPVTVDGDGDLIDGAPNVVIGVPGGSGVFLYDAGQWRRLVARRAIDRFGQVIEFGADAQSLAFPFGTTGSGPVVLQTGPTISGLSVINGADVSGDFSSDGSIFYESATTPKFRGQILRFQTETAAPGSVVIGAFGMLPDTSVRARYEVNMAGGAKAGSWSGVGTFLRNGAGAAALVGIVNADPSQQTTALDNGSISALGNNVSVSVNAADATARTWSCTLTIQETTT